MINEEYLTPKIYFPSQLKSRIRKEPLTRKDVRKILENVVEKICIFDLNIAEGMAFQTPRRKCIVCIDSKKDKEGQKKILIHEIVHIRYSLWGGYGSSVLQAPEWIPGYSEETGADYHMKMERMINAEAMRFCQENYDFIEEVFSRCSCV